jgi:hypothetical protein
MGHPQIELAECTRLHSSESGWNEEADRRVECSTAVDKLKPRETEGLFGECDRISIRTDRTGIVLSGN